MKVLVTGGAGFIGSHIIEELIKYGHHPVVVDNLSTGNKDFVPVNVKLYELDVADKRVEEVFTQEKPEIVIHQAAQIDVTKSLEDPFMDAWSNILGTIRLLYYSEKYNVKKFIYASSSAVYGETKDISISEDFLEKPISFYGISKFTSEQYIKIFHYLYNIPYTILRYANVYGPRQGEKGEGGVIAIFINKMLNNEPVSIYGDGEQSRDFIYVKDVAKANIQAVENAANEIINIGCNKKTKINQLYQLLSSKIDVSIKNPIYQGKRDGDILYSQLNNERAEMLLKWKPTYSINSGLLKTVDYYKKELASKRLKDE